MFKNEFVIILLSLDFRTEQGEEGLNILEANFAEISKKRSHGLLVWVICWHVWSF